MTMVCRVIPVLAVVIALAGAQQPNVASASAVWGGIDGPPWPITVVVPTAGTLSFVVSGVPNQPFALVQATAGLSPSFLSTPFGALDVDLSGGFAIVLDGINGTSLLDHFATTGSFGTSSWTLNLSGMSAGYLGGLQVLIGDPSAPTGFRLTAATQIFIQQPSTIYVSASTGAPGNPGTQTAPLSTIAAGIALAWTQSPAWIHVASGTYAETPTFLSGVSIRGGFDPVTWTPSTAPTIIQTGSTGAIANGAVAVTLESLTFQPANGSGIFYSAGFPYFASGGSSITVQLKTGADITFTACTFTPGAGASGPPGTPGQPGSAGGNGIAGSPGAVGNGGGAGGAGGGGGGAGGAGGYASAAGSTGTPGSAPIGTGAPGGPGGAANNFCFAGVAGSPGQPGGPGTGALHGPGGGPGNLIGPLGNWLSFGGQNGTDATQGWGYGGGGGGGGGGHPSVNGFCGATTGAGGGGGGGGGTNGTSGTAGAGGGPAIGVSIVNSSATFVQCTFNGGIGGNGGAGGASGAGGAGGLGGPGGPGATGMGAGGSGGPGGAGSPGGGGGGGAGGSSLGVRRSGSPNVTFVGTNVWNPGTPGAGGGGGAGSNFGANGASALIYGN